MSLEPQKGSRLIWAVLWAAALAALISFGLTRRVPRVPPQPRPVAGIPAVPVPPQVESPQPASSEAPAPPARPRLESASSLAAFDSEKVRGDAPRKPKRKGRIIELTGDVARPYEEVEDCPPGRHPELSDFPKPGDMICRNNPQ